MQLLARVNDTEPDSAKLTPDAVIRTSRDDLLFGSYRAQMTIPERPGVITGFTHVCEKDALYAYTTITGIFVAALNSTHQMLATGSVDGIPATIGNLTTLNGEFSIRNFATTSRSHEYRFDYLADRLDIYIDGRLILSHLFKYYKPERSGYMDLAVFAYRDGAPEIKEDQVVTIGYAKGYFNTTDHESEVGQRWREEQCSGWDINDRVATIPTEHWQEGDGETFFFSKADTYNERSLKHTNIHWLSSSAPGLQSLSLVTVVVLAAVAGFAAMLV